MNGSPVVEHSLAQSAATSTMPPLLQVRSLETHFKTRSSIVRAVDGVSFSLEQGKTLCVVGESGSGKSALARSIMQIVPRPGRIVGGSILLRRAIANGEMRVVDLATLDPKGREIRSVRGLEVAMVFQEPMSSLSPVHTIGAQIVEMLRLHTKLTRREAKERAIESLEQVRIPRPRQGFDSYSFEFSGGMRQRVMIAMALACNPKLLIADEPTTALDVTIQAQILELLDDLRKTRELAVLLITHDLGVVAEVADRVAVMYTGKIVEESPVEELFTRPKHPYTEGLLRSVPKLTAEQVAKKERLETIEGVVPSPTNLPPGCHFAPRCSHRMPHCTEGPIPLFDLEGGVTVRCVLYDLAAAVAADR